MSYKCRCGWDYETDPPIRCTPVLIGGYEFAISTIWYHSPTTYGGCGEHAETMILLKGEERPADRKDWGDWMRTRVVPDRGPWADPRMGNAALLARYHRLLAARIRRLVKEWEASQ